MNIERGYSIDEKFYKKAKEEHFKVLQAKAAKAQAEHVKNSIPEHNPIEELDLINLLIQATGLSEEEIIAALQNLVNSRQVATAKGYFNGKTYYRKSL